MSILDVPENTGGCKGTVPLQRTEKQEGGWWGESDKQGVSLQANPNCLRSSQQTTAPRPPCSPPIHPPGRQRAREVNAGEVAAAELEGGGGVVGGSGGGGLGEGHCSRSKVRRQETISIRVKATVFVTPCCSWGPLHRTRKPQHSPTGAEVSFTKLRLLAMSSPCSGQGNAEHARWE
jgi:hypothetical protein